jgi:hypothetical protein
MLCSTTSNWTIQCISGSKAEIPPGERELVRAGFEAALDAGWPGYIANALANAQPAA